MKLLHLRVVLAAIDYDDTSVAVLTAARALADAGGAKLHVVHVDPPRAVTAVPDEIEGTSIDAAVALLGRANVPVDSAQVHVIAGEPAHVIRVLADRVRADVIVLGPHRERSAGQPSLRELGGTALAIATASWAPCLIVSGRLRLPLERVLVPVDLSDTARGALMVALSWSSALRAARPAVGNTTDAVKLTALHVTRDKDSPASTAPTRTSTSERLSAELDGVRGEAGTWAGVEIEGETVASSDVAGAIAARARKDDANLIVLGTRGLGLDAVGRLGTVSSAVVHGAEVPVLLVPPAVWAEKAAGA
jgi:nucleotide-binding universal stress UspA family protein